MSIGIPPLDQTHDLSHHGEFRRVAHLDVLAVYFGDSGDAAGQPVITSAAALIPVPAIQREGACYFLTYWTEWCWQDEPVDIGEMIDDFCSSGFV